MTFRAAQANPIGDRHESEIHEVAIVAENSLIQFKNKQPKLSARQGIHRLDELFPLSNIAFDLMIQPRIEDQNKRMCRACRNMSMLGLLTSRVSPLPPP